jgi:hypothetical protein
MRAYITSWCLVKNNSVMLNGKTVYSFDGEASLFLKEAYKALEMNYPKFHKMDHLSKLGIIAAEFCLKNSEFLQKNDPAETAIILSNKASSLDTDRQHQESIQHADKYLPSPAVFVYTLPNIVIGEIAIKHKITGENAFFVCDKFDPALLSNYTLQLLETGAAGSAIGGWVNYDGGDYEAFIYLAEMQDDSIKNTNFKPLNNITLNQLYQQH